MRTLSNITQEALLRAELQRMNEREAAERQRIRRVRRARWEGHAAVIAAGLGFGVVVVGVAAGLCWLAGWM